MTGAIKLQNNPATLTGTAANGTWKFRALRFLGNGPVKAYIEIAGTWGGASATIGYEALDGSFSPFKNATGNPVVLTANESIDVGVPFSNVLGMVITNATGSTSLKAAVKAAG